MAKFTQVSARQISNTANSATYECTVSATGTSYFGVLNQTTCLAIKAWNRYMYYWGFPKANKWKASWGSPSYYLSSGSYYNGRLGNLQGKLDNRSYTWTETVPIDRGNSRQGTMDVTVGLQYTGTDQRFGSALQTLRLYTTEISKGYINTFSGSADSSNTVGDRYIRLYCSFTNPESFYNCRLYDANGTLITTSSGTDFNYNILITKDMYQTTKRYDVKLYGKDGTCYDNKSVVVSIEPSGAGVWAKLNNTTTEINKLTFKNVNFKEAKEVWIKKDGAWRKTKK